MTTPTVRCSRAAAGALAVVLANAGCGTDDAPSAGSRTSRATVVGTTVEPTADTTVASTEATTVPATATSDGGPNPTTAPGGDMVDGAGTTFGPADDGATIRLSVGQSARLVLPLDAKDPSATGEAVELIEFVFVDASDRREFEVRAVAAGRSEVVCADPALRLTFVVEG